MLSVDEFAASERYTSSFFLQPLILSVLNYLSFFPSLSLFYYIYFLYKNCCQLGGKSRALYMMKPSLSLLSHTPYGYGPSEELLQQRAPTFPLPLYFSIQSGFPYIQIYIFKDRNFHLNSPQFFFLTYSLSSSILTLTSV